MPPIIFFGSDAFSLPSLEGLHSAGWNIKAVVTKPDSPAGRGRKLTAPIIKTWAEEHHVAVLQPEKLATATDILNNFSVHLGVVASYGKFIPDSVLSLFRLGLVNVHPSLLPKYRGPSPIEAAILNGDRQTGVSLMRVTSKMDAGPIYAQKSYDLTGTETQPDLYVTLARLGAAMLIHNLPGIARGQVQPAAQNDDQTVITNLIQKTDGQIDWKQPAEQIQRQIRAYLTWPGSRTELFGREVIITQAQVVTHQPSGAKPGMAAKDTDAITVATGKGSLVIKRLKPTGKRDMSATEFLAGLK